MSAVAPDTFSRGPGTFSVSRKALHSKTRAKMVEAMREVVAPESQGIVLLQIVSGSRGAPVPLAAFWMDALGQTVCGVGMGRGGQGGVDRTFESTDSEILFRQESNFHYLFGVEEPNFLGAVDLRSGATTLFAPRLPQEYAVWMGPLMSRQDLGDKYAVDEVQWVEDIAKHLRAANPPQLHVLCGTNSDSGLSTTAATFEGIDSFKVERELLYDVLAECRVRKLPEEIEIIEYCNLIGSQGHVKVMQESARCQMEFQLEAAFLNHCYYKGGCRHAPYTPICSSGPNSAILHYGHAGAPNSRQLSPDDMVLTDMGCEYYRYGSDITTSWPASGRFSPRQALVYNAVLDAHRTVAAAMKPGVSWPDLHRLAQERILTGLLAGGLVTGTVSDMMRVHLAAVFMPHGLGHLLGIDTHDVGGYLPGCPPRIDEPSLRSLRTARTLEEGMVVTLEPGCYFNPVLLRPALQDASQSPFLIPEALEEFMEFGGVRLEDNIVITADGSRSLTDVPRSIEDVEAVMAGAAWPRE